MMDNQPLRVSESTLHDERALLEEPAAQTALVTARPIARAPVFDTPRLVDIVALRSSERRCSECRLCASCLPGGLARDELVEHVDNRLVSLRRKASRGEALFRAGDRFDAVFVVWSGFFKTVMSSPPQRGQVTGFQMIGEILGLDGISTGRHEVDAIALEDSQVCKIGFADLEAIGRAVPRLQRQFHRVMSREITREGRAMLTLGTSSAEERVAAFVLDMTNRLQRRGFSASSMLLRMSREEIGSLLGLKLETVSRAFSKLQASGLVFVRQKQVWIVDLVGLRTLVGGRG